MQHKFEHNGQQYIAEVSDHLWASEPSSRHVDATHEKHRKEPDWFLKQQLQRLEGIAKTSLATGRRMTWQGEEVRVLPIGAAEAAPAAQPTA